VTGYQPSDLPFGQDKIGTYSVQANRKWGSVFSYYQVQNSGYQQGDQGDEFVKKSP
jgi:hypothetical protein